MDNRNNPGSPQKSPIWGPSKQNANVNLNLDEIAELLVTIAPRIASYQLRVPHPLMTAEAKLRLGADRARRWGQKLGPGGKVVDFNG